MLDAQRLRNGLSRLGRAADGRRQVLLQLTLQVGHPQIGAWIRNDTA